MNSLICKQGITAFLICALLSPISSHADGPGGTGGGQGLVCRNTDGTVASARLLDTSEATDFYLLKLKPQPENSEYLDIANRFALKLDAAIPNTFPTGSVGRGFAVNPGALLGHVDGQNRIAVDVAKIDLHKMMIPGKLQIPAIGDSHPHVIPVGVGCNLEQIAIYNDSDDSVHFVELVWNQLSNVDKAALLVHEALYHEMRLLGDTTSDQTRRTVANLFSGMNFKWIFDGVPEQALTCWTDGGDFQFLIYPNQGGLGTAQFLVYDSQVMLTKTTIQVDMASFDIPFGVAQPSRLMNAMYVGTIKNPLLERPEWAVTERPDLKGNVTNTYIEATMGMAGKRMKKITCNPKLTTFTIQKGSVGVSEGPY